MAGSRTARTPWPSQVRHTPPSNADKRSGSCAHARVQVSQPKLLVQAIKLEVVASRCKAGQIVRIEDPSLPSSCA